MHTAVQIVLIILASLAVVTLLEFALGFLHAALTHRREHKHHHLHSGRGCYFNNVRIELPAWNDMSIGGQHCTGSTEYVYGTRSEDAAALLNGVRVCSGHRESILKLARYLAAEQQGFWVTAMSAEEFR